MQTVDKIQAFDKDMPWFFYYRFFTDDQSLCDN